MAIQILSQYQEERIGKHKVVFSCEFKRHSKLSVPPRLWYWRIDGKDKGKYERTYKDAVSAARREIGEELLIYNL